MNNQLWENSFSAPFRISIGIFVLMGAASLCMWVPPQVVFAPVLGIAWLWIVFHHPMGTLGAVLAFVPVDFMVIAVGKFVGIPYMTVVSACDKEIVLLLLTYLLWRRNSFKWAVPDWFLLVCFALAVIRTAFSGTLVGLASGFDFMIPYAAGRVAVLSKEQEQLWATCAVWIVAVLAVLGMVEVFILGEGPRTLLYLAIKSETEGGALTSPFHGVGLVGLREAATMVGPNGFGALCMIALIIWWVYCHNPLPAIMIAAGLICSVTRSAWLGVAVAITLLAVMMGQKKRLVLYSAIALTLFAVAIPVLGLTDYLYFSKTGQDSSTEWHQDAISTGLRYAADHPFGSGNSKRNPEAAKDDKQDDSVVIFETTYPELAAEYGIATTLCFVGFLFSALGLVWRKQSQLEYMALGILVGLGVVMTVSLPLWDRRLTCWALFPIGLAIRSSISHRIPPMPNTERLRA